PPELRNCACENPSGRGLPRILPRREIRAARCNQSFSDNSRMPSTATSAPMTSSAAPLSALDVDLIVLPWLQREPLGSFADLDRAASGELTRAIESGEFS